jgi:hypothetical protein
MKKTFLSVSLLIIHFSGFSQIRNDTTLRAFAFVDTLLIAGKHNFEVVDYVYPQKIQDIGVKMNNAIAANKEWFLDYTKKYYVPGEGIPYDPHMGISENEFSLLKSIDTVQTQLKVLKVGEVEIYKSDGLITFKTLGENRFLDFLSVNIKKHLMIFASDTIHFSQAMDVNNIHRLGHWRGYSWSNEKSNGPNPATINDIGSKVTNLIFANTATGQRFIRIEIQQVDKGKTVVNADLLVFLE